jgi:hypothetical protein
MMSSVWRAPANDIAAALSPDPGDFRHHRDKRLVIKVLGE